MPDLDHITPVTHPLQHDFTILDFSHPLLSALYDAASKKLPPSAPYEQLFKRFFSDLLSCNVSSIPEKQQLETFEIDLSTLRCANRYLHHWTQEDVNLLNDDVAEVVNVLRKDYMEELQRKGQALTFDNLIRLIAETTITIEYISRCSVTKPTLHQLTAVMQQTPGLQTFNISPKFLLKFL